MRRSRKTKEYSIILPNNETCLAGKNKQESKLIELVQAEYSLTDSDKCYFYFVKNKQTISFKLQFIPQFTHQIQSENGKKFVIYELIKNGLNGSLSSDDEFNATAKFIHDMVNNTDANSKETVKEKLSQIMDYEGKLDNILHQLLERPQYNSNKYTVLNSDKMSSVMCVNLKNIEIRQLTSPFNVEKQIEWSLIISVKKRRRTLQFSIQKSNEYSKNLGAPEVPEKLEIQCVSNKTADAAFQYINRCREFIGSDDIGTHGYGDTSGGFFQRTVSRIRKSFSRMRTKTSAPKNPPAKNQQYGDEVGNSSDRLASIPAPAQMIKIHDDDEDDRITMDNVSALSIGGNNTSKLEHRDSHGNSSFGSGSKKLNRNNKELSSITTDEHQSSIGGVSNNIMGSTNTAPINNNASSNTNYNQNPSVKTNSTYEISLGGGSEVVANENTITNNDSSPQIANGVTNKPEKDSATTVELRDNPSSPSKSPNDIDVTTNNLTSFGVSGSVRGRHGYGNNQGPMSLPQQFHSILPPAPMPPLEPSIVDEESLPQPDTDPSAHAMSSFGMSQKSPIPVPPPRIQENVSPSDHISSHKDNDSDDLPLMSLLPPPSEDEPEELVNQDVSVNNEEDFSTIVPQYGPQDSTEDMFTSLNMPAAPQDSDDEQKDSKEDIKPSEKKVESKLPTLSGSPSNIPSTRKTSIPSPKVARSNIGRPSFSAAQKSIPASSTTTTTRGIPRPSLGMPASPSNTNKPNHLDNNNKENNVKQHEENFQHFPREEDMRLDSKTVIKSEATVGDSIIRKSTSIEVKSEITKPENIGNNNNSRPSGVGLIPPKQYKTTTTLTSTTKKPVATENTSPKIPTSRIPTSGIPRIAK